MTLNSSVLGGIFLRHQHRRRPGRQDDQAGCPGRRTKKIVLNRTSRATAKVKVRYLDSATVSSTASKAVRITPRRR
jgi:hypothetical protein